MHQNHLPTTSSYYIPRPSYPFIKSNPPKNSQFQCPCSYPKTSFTPEYLITTRRNHTSSSGSDSDSKRIFGTPPALDLYMIESTGKGIVIILALIFYPICHLLGVGQDKQKKNLPEIVEEEEEEKETLPVKAGSLVTAPGPGGLAAPQIGITLKEQDGSSDAPSSSGGRSSPSP